MTDMVPPKETDFIDAAEARLVVEKALFGDDWIGPLSTEELELLGGPFGPQRKRLSNGRTINIIARCPQQLRNKIDRAWGRAERAYIQSMTAIDILHDHGFKDVDRAFQLERFNRFLARISRPETEATAKRNVGKPRDLIDGVILKMASDARYGIDIESFKGKELGVRYGVSRNTAVAARREVREKLARK
jgi:hypothetical protein